MLAPIFFALIYVSWIIVIVVMPLAFGLLLIGYFTHWRTVVASSLGVLIGVGGPAVFLLVLFGLIRI